MSGFFDCFLRFVALVLGVSPMQNFPPPLKAEEERALFLKAREGDKGARGKLIEHNLRLVSHIIRKYYGSSEDPDELLSVGSLGLIKAVDTFRPEKGTRFATYGARCIQNEILMHFRGKKKTQGEISMSETIDVDRDGNPLTYLDVISVDDTIAEDIDLKVHTDRVRALVSSILDAREKEIVVLRYGLMGYAPRTQREVAAYLKISRSYVSRIEKKALEKMKRAFGDQVPDFD